MDKNDFDMDFDFEKQFGLGLDSLSADEFGQDDLNSADAKSLDFDFTLDFDDDKTAGGNAQKDDNADLDFSLDDLDLDSFLPEEEYEEEPDGDVDLSDLGLDGLNLFGEDADSDSCGDSDEYSDFGDGEDADADFTDGELDDFRLHEDDLDEESLYESEEESDEETESEEAYQEEEPYPEEEPQEAADDEALEEADSETPAESGEDDVDVPAFEYGARGMGMGDEEPPAFDEEEKPKRKKASKPAFAGLAAAGAGLIAKLKKPKKDKADAQAPAEDNEGKTRRRREKPKSDKPSIWAKILELYLGPITHRGQEESLENLTDRPRRRRRKTKLDIFKEVYLPPIIVLAALCVILSFIVGSVTNAFKQKAINDEKRRREHAAAAQAEEVAKTEMDVAIAQAEAYAANFDYDEAIGVLEKLIAAGTSNQEELLQKKSEYLKAQSDLVEWKDLSQIPNLSFHVLIADPVRAFANKDYGGLYNRNFVTVDEFERILKELYANNYILVDFHNLVGSNVGVDGKTSYFADPLYLPAGKSPVMITETLVNYFDYMIDSNKDGQPDAGGSGFASKLVVRDGSVKAQMVDASGNTVEGNYDLVPVLEDFIAEHPDFAFKGSRATLAVTGEEGIFGYRTNTSYISSRGQGFYEQEVAEAKVLVQTLREMGYTLACFTYGNVNYKSMTVPQIQADLQNWVGQIVPVMGETDVLVYAREGDIDDYTGNKFTLLHNAGFRFFVTNGESPTTDIRESFVRQSRLMVTGNAMGWYSSRFSKYFDANKVLDMTNRKSIPN